MGFIFGPIAVIVAFLLSRKSEELEARALKSGSRKCPDCAELVKVEAVKCRFCSAPLSQGS